MKISSWHLLGLGAGASNATACCEASCPWGSALSINEAAHESGSHQMVGQEIFQQASTWLRGMCELHDVKGRMCGHKSLLGSASQPPLPHNSLTAVAKRSLAQASSFGQSAWRFELGNRILNSTCIA